MLPENTFDNLRKLILYRFCLFFFQCIVILPFSIAIYSFLSRAWYHSFLKVLLFYDSWSTKAHFCFSQESNLYRHVALVILSACHRQHVFATGILEAEAELWVRERENVCEVKEAEVARGGPSTHHHQTRPVAPLPTQPRFPCPPHTLLPAAH